MYKKKENPLRLLPADPEKRGKIKIRLEDILKERDISLISYLSVLKCRELS